jgi:hypothetical protein
VSTDEAEIVCGETYQLIGAIVAECPGLIPNAEKWLDNLAEGKLVHKGLLPVELRRLLPLEIKLLHRQRKAK